VLASFDFYRPRHRHPDPDRLVDMGDEGSREMAVPCLVSKDNDTALNDEECAEDPSEDVHIPPGEAGLGYEMSYNRIRDKCG
jgi:hypothetical protein